MVWKTETKQSQMIKTDFWPNGKKNRQKKKAVKVKFFFYKTTIHIKLFHRYQLNASKLLY